MEPFAGVDSGVAYRDLYSFHLFIRLIYFVHGACCVDVRLVADVVRLSPKFSLLTDHSRVGRSALMCFLCVSEYNNCVTGIHSSVTYSGSAPLMETLYPSWPLACMLPTHMRIVRLFKIGRSADPFNPSV